MTRRLSLTILAGVAALAAAAPAAAQRVDRITAFGDSYADSDNALQLGLIPPAFLPLYPTGRFTGGTNYVDTLGDIYGLTPENFAIGGARANPDFLFEVNSFLAGGGGVFPTVVPAFDSGDLLTVSIGGNDARGYAASGGASVAAAPTAAATAVAAAETGLDALVGAGAPTISFLAGDTGKLPEIAGNPAQAAIRTAYSTAFNSGMQSVLAGYAADGVMVHYLDLTLLLQQVQANPQAYGFTSAWFCEPIAQCLADPNHANQFVFWVDALHPTSRASALFAQYVAAQLQAPLTLGSTSDLALDTARQFARILNGRADLSSGGGGLELFVLGDGFQRDVALDSATDAYDVDGYGVTVGASYGFGNGVVGIAANHSRPRARFDNGTGRTRTKSWQVGAFANYALGDAFAQAYAGYGSDNHRISRMGVLAPLTGRPDGDHWLAGAKAGYLVPFGGVRAGPIVALDYARAKVGAYTEGGDPVLALRVNSVSAKALTGSAGLELRGNPAPDGPSIRPFLAAVAEKDLAGDSRTVRFAQTSAPVIVNSWRLEDRSTDVYGRLTAGADARVLGAVGVTAIVSGTVGRDDGDELSGQIGASVRF